MTGHQRTAEAATDQPPTPLPGRSLSDDAHCDDITYAQKPSFPWNEVVGKLHNEPELKSWISCMNEAKQEQEVKF